MEQSNANCEKLNELIKNFFEFESPEQLSEKISLLLGNYIVNAPVEKTDLANASYVFNRLTAFMYSLKELQKQQAGVLHALITEDAKQCMHN